MGRYFHYWYGVLYYEKPGFLETRATLIRAHSLPNARDILEEKIDSFILRNPDAKENRRELFRIKQYDINYGLLKRVRKEMVEQNFEL